MLSLRRQKRLVDPRASVESRATRRKVAGRSNRNKLRPCGGQPGKNPFAAAVRHFCVPCLTRQSGISGSAVLRTTPCSANAELHGPALHYFASAGNVPTACQRNPPRWFLVATAFASSGTTVAADDRLYSIMARKADLTRLIHVVNHVTWLADANLPAQQRFGIPLCDASGAEPCVNRSGSMNYASATAWIAAMNAANYLGHSNWQLPTTPFNDRSCRAKAPAPYGNSFGFGCNANALGYLYYTALGFQAPRTAVPEMISIMFCR
jgi:hypothetical protein